MTEEQRKELKQVATDLAKNLSGYPMLITILSLVGVIAWMSYEGDRITRNAIQKLVYEQLEWDRKILEICFERQDQ